MTFLRNIGQDLVDKKLWPLVAVLVAMLVAVPVVLGGGGEETAPTPDPSASAAVAGAAPQTAGISVATEEPARADRPRSRRDPFEQQFVKKVPDVTVATSDPAKETATGGKGTAAPKDEKSVTSGGGGSATPAPATTPSTPRKSAPKVDALDVYRVALRFGEPGEQRTLRDVARLSPLPNADRPFFVLLGVLSGGKKAVFLVSSDATPTGDGTCRPSKSDCQTIELTAGDTQFFDLETDTGVVQYQLDLVSIRRRAGATSTTSGAPVTSKAKRETGDDAADAVAAGTGYRWDADRGVLVRRAAKATTRAVTGAATDESAAERAAREASEAAVLAWSLEIIASIRATVAALTPMSAPADATPPAPTVPAVVDAIPAVGTPSP